MASNIPLSELTSDSSRGAPVDCWNPKFCGDIPLKIKFDGTWTYLNSPITRASLVKLFASVLKREGENYFLVTPVEKVGIEVEDVPFVITQWQHFKNAIKVSTQTGNQFTLSNAHPVHCAVPRSKIIEPMPYALVRKNLLARFHQNVYYQMIELAEHKQTHKENHLTELWMSSAEYRFVIGQYEDI